MLRAIVLAARSAFAAAVVLVLALPAPAQGGRVVRWGVGGAPTPFHFVSVAAGGGHSLAVTDDGTVLAWGWNDDDQATVPAGLSGVKAVAAGDRHSVALKRDGTVVAWGSQRAAMVPAGLSGVVAVAAGSGTTLAVKDDGTVVAWGTINYDGQLNVPAGLSGVIAVAASSGTSLAVKDDGTVVSWGSWTAPAGLSGVIAVAAADQAFIALKNDGTVVVWGDLARFTPPSGLTGVTAVAGGGILLAALKSDGTVVIWGPGSNQGPPPDLSGVVAVATGGGHLLALRGDATVVAWGADFYGQATLPDRVGPVVAVAAGWAHSLGLRGDGTVVAWGSDSHGQVTVPQELVGATATTVAAGGDHSLALKGDGTVVAWGRNGFGQTTLPAEELAGTTVRALAAGGNHSLALRHDGTVVAWGRNLEGQLNVPAGLSGVIAVAAGGNHSLALTDAGRVFAWGNNNYQQAVVPEAALSGVVAVAAGYHHSLALKGDGTVVAWGRNDDYGQATVPIGLSGVVAVAAGYQHSLALKADGAVVAWGRNLENQLDVPAGLSGVTAVAAGQYHSLALLAPTGSVTVVGGHVGACPADGTGRVSSSPGAISCGATCSDRFDPGTRVTLTATPEPGSLFAGWVWPNSQPGPCPASPTAPCVAYVYQQNVEVAARFSLLAASNQLTIQTNGAGSGTVTTDPRYSTAPPISCSANAGVCGGRGDSCMTVVLVPTPAEGSVFAGFSGDISDPMAPGVPRMDRNRTITATFNPAAPTHHHVTVVTAGTGQGTVATADTDPAISCSGNAGTCSGIAAAGATVTLTATPAAGSLFAGWSGWCTGAGPCVLIVGGDRTVTAQFVSAAPTHLLTLATAGTGQGTVATPDTDPAISCSGNAGSCSGSAAQGATVTLTATAAGGSVFAGWSGACSGNGGCVVTMDAAKAVTARFDLEGGGRGGGGGGCAAGGSGGALALLIAALALCRPVGRRRLPARRSRAPQAAPFLPYLALLAFLLPGCSGGGDGGGDTCPAPTLAQCQDPTWLETDRCGIAERDAMAADEDAPCSQLLLAEAERQTQDRPEGEVALPQELGGGTEVAKVATGRDARLSDVYMPGTYTGSANAVAATATESGLSAAEQAKRTLWATNGIRIESCEEYVYEKYYEYSLFEDALAGERENAPALVDAVFGPADDVRSIGTRGMDGARLRTREGRELGVQAPQKEYLFDIDLSPSFEYQAWNMAYVANPFVAMPKEFLSPAEWEQYGLGALRPAMGLESYTWVPPDPSLRWRWHRDARAALVEAGQSLAEADAMYPTIRQFTRLMGTYRGHKGWPASQCCSTDPGGECCAQHEATTTSLGAQLRELFDRAVAAGCMEPGPTICSWSPAYLSDALRGAFENVHRMSNQYLRGSMATFAMAMEDDFKRCVARTGDDLAAAAAWTFQLPDGSTWPSASSCAGRLDWPTCPVTDGAASPSAMDTFFYRFLEWEQAVRTYWQNRRAAMPPELFDEGGWLRSQLKGGHADRHEAGNKLFGVYFEYEAGWSLPVVTPSEDPDRAALCFASAEAHAGFAVGGRAFGSATVEIASASTNFRLGDIDGDFTVLGARFWNPIGAGGELYVNSTFGIKPAWIVPRGEPLRYAFTVAGWPMSMEAGITGSFAVTPIYETTRALEYKPGEPCWRLRSGFTPSIKLDAVAALNLLDIKVVKAGLRVNVTYFGLSLPIAWEVSQRTSLAESVLLSVDVTDELVVQILAGRISAFVWLGIDPFRWTVSKDLFSWPGVTMRTTLQPPVHIVDLSMSDLAILLGKQLPPEEAAAE